MSELNEAMVEAAITEFRKPAGIGESMDCVFRRILTTALALLPEAEGWQPIETALFQKTVIVGKAGTALRVTAYRMGQNSYWRHVHTSEKICFEPTHWRPLPAPPPAEGL